MVESFEQRYAKALVIRKVQQGMKWCASTTLVPDYVWYLDASKPYLRDFLDNRIPAMKLPAWPANPEWKSEGK